MTKFNELKRIFKILRGPGGCPWDRRQTHTSILKNLKEETGEFACAVRRRDYRNMEEELGDILLQVMFHSQMASDKGKFDIEDVIDHLIKKLKRRHPHVFGSVKVKSVKEVLANWHAIKRNEKQKKIKNEKKKWIHAD